MIVNALLYFETTLEMSINFETIGAIVIFNYLTNFYEIFHYLRKLLFLFTLVMTSSNESPAEQRMSTPLNLLQNTRVLKSNFEMTIVSYQGLNDYLLIIIFLKA